MRFKLSERGDTLVEVTIALAILSLILSGAFVTANRAFGIGQNAKERTQMVSDAQAQAEALSSFRDSYAWNEFINGNVATTLPGIRVRTASADCDLAVAGVQRCFHMEMRTIGGKRQWVPVTGAMTDSQLGGQGKVYITSDNIDPSETYDFTIVYRVPARGGGPDLVSSIKTRLTNLDGLR